ncbi:hypothetical protein [Oricola cellulosilytica]|uniref:hypothetical protein n=1 Tax=Oricola cellulosilytica TaxID=1429082 RepID=UPI0018EE876D|nr:hypothetical protein [Oricola cellulosilytica]
MAFEQDRNFERPASKLVDAVRQVKIAAADRSDVVVEMREADRTRLELLAQELAPVIDEVPVEDDRFDFAISSGLQPRFWIDATAHVAMGPDRRTYRFIRDTRMGRIVLSESTDKGATAEKVTGYIASRIHERELAFAGETVSVREIVSGRIDDNSLPGKTERDGPAEPAAGAPSRGTADAGGELSRTRVTQSSSTGLIRMSAADAERAPARPRRSVVRSLLGGLGWIAVGAVAGGGTLIWLFRDYLF